MSNVIPRITGLSATPQINENGTAILNGTFTDSDASDVHTVSVDWGPGQATSSTVLPVGQRTFSISHQYLDDGTGPGNGTTSDTYLLSVTVADNNGGSVTSGTSNGSGSGAVIIDGGDRDDHGSSSSGVNQNGWKYIEQMVGYAYNGHLNSGSGILVVGASFTALNAINSAAGVLGRTTTVVTGAAIGTVNFNNYAMIYVPSDSNDTSGGISSTDLTALAVRKTDVQNFINNGGSLVALTEAGATQPYSWLELPNPFTISTSVASDRQYRTQALINSGLTISDAELTAGTPLHNVFTGPVGFNGLVPFVYNVGGDRANNNGGGDDQVVTLGLPAGSAGVGLSVKVGNVAPSNVVLNSGSISEDGTFTLIGSFADPGTLDAHTVAINWQDGSAVTTLTLPAGVLTFSASHQYLDDGPSPGDGTASDTYAVTATVTDDDTGSGSASTSVTVNNVAPTVTGLVVTSPVNENGTAHLTGTVADPGTKDAFTAVVDWGDGTGNQTYVIAAGSTTFDLSHQYLDDSPSGTPSDTYTVKVVSFTDDDGGAASTSGAGGGGNIYLTGHDVQLHGRQNSYDSVILDYLRGAGTPGEIARTSYRIGYLTTVNRGYTPGGGDFGPVTTHSPTTFAGAADFASFLASVDVLYIPWIFDVTDAGSAAINSFAPQITAFVNAGGDIAAESSFDRATFYNFLPPAAVATGSPIGDSSGFVATSAGTAIGITNSMINGFPTHNSFPTFSTAFTVMEKYNPTGQAVSLGLSNAVISGGGITTGLSVTVTNVAPTVTSLTPSSTSIAENGTVTVTGSFTDPGTLDTHTAVVDWGDGTSSPATVNQVLRTFTASHQYLDDGPSPGNGTASDAYTITATVTDDDTGSVTASTTTTVTNVAPVLDALSATSVLENGVATLTGTYHDAGTQDTHTLTINWGEGLPQTVVVTGGAFSVTHQYLDDNPTGTASDVYTIGVTLTDDDTGSVTASTTTTVTNVAPVLTSFATSSPDCGGAAEGQSVTISASFGDVGTRDTHTAVVDWGDGTPASVVTVAELNGSGTVSGSHVYASGGVFTVKLTLTDDDSGVATRTAPAVVTGAGVLNGVLQVVGTDRDDHVTINQQGDGTIEVHSDFFNTPLKTFAAAGITSILVILCDGNDDVTISGGIALPSIISGGKGNDLLNGGGGSNIILGGDGDDMLIGGANRDLLIGGSGVDRLVSNGNDDIMIGGSTVYDGSTAYDMDMAALQAVMDEWNAADSYLTRTTRIRNGFTRGSRTIKLGGGNVVDDLAADILTGSSGQDWYFLGVGDTSPGRGSNELNG